MNKQQDISSEYLSDYAIYNPDHPNKFLSWNETVQGDLENINQRKPLENRNIFKNSY